MVIPIPYDIRVRGGKHCVIKRGERNVRPGRCHDTRAQAIKQQSALYAAEKDSQRQAAQEVTGMSTTGTSGNPDVTITFTDSNTGSVIRFAPVTDTEDVETEDSTTSWEGVLGVIGHPVPDGRILIPGEISNRDLPLPLMVQKLTSAEGHAGSEVAGKIETIQYIPMGEFDKDGFSLDGVPDSATIVYATGVFDGSDAAHEAERLLENGAGISLDIPTDRLALIDPDSLEEVEEDKVDLADVLSGKYLTGLAGKIAGATVVTIGAFEEARITITEDGALVASGYGLRITGRIRNSVVIDRYEWNSRDGLVASASVPKPAAEWFQNPNFTRLTALTIGEKLKSGYRRISGHLADWDGCHTGFSEVCVPPFRSQTDYAYFNVGEIECDNGQMVPVGKLMFSRELPNGHAPTTPEWGAREASKYYDDSTKIGGFVRAGSDRFGTWLAGVTRIDLDDEDLQILRANPPSGDWRPIPGKGSELVAAFCVPVPGFPIPRMLVASAGEGGLTIITAPLSLEIGPRALARQKMTLKARKAMALAHFELEPESEDFATITAAQRRRWAKSGVARPDGSFPITKCTGDGTSAVNARRAIGRANESDREAVRRHIAKRERVLGCSSE